MSCSANNTSTYNNIKKFSTIESNFQLNCTQKSDESACSNVATNTTNFQKNIPSNFDCNSTLNNIINDFTNKDIGSKSFTMTLEGNSTTSPNTSALTQLIAQLYKYFTISGEQITSLADFIKQNYTQGSNKVLYLLTVGSIVGLVIFKEIYSNAYGKNESKFFSFGKLMPLVTIITFVGSAYIGYNNTGISFQQYYESLFIILGCMLGALGAMAIYEEGDIMNGLIMFFGVAVVIGSSVVLNKVMGEVKYLESKDLDEDVEKGIIQKTSDVNTYVTYFMYATLSVILFLILSGFWVSGDTPVPLNPEGGIMKLLGSVAYLAYTAINGLMLVALPYLFIPIIIISNVIRLFLIKKDKQSPLSKIMPMWAMPGEFLFKLLLNYVTDGAMSFDVDGESASTSIRPQNMTKQQATPLRYIVLGVFVLLVIGLLYIWSATAGMSFQGFLVCLVLGFFVCGIVLSTLGFGISKMLPLRMPNWLSSFGSWLLCFGRNFLPVALVCSLIAGLSYWCYDSVCQKKSWCMGFSWGALGISLGVGIATFLLSIIGCYNNKEQFNIINPFIDANNPGAGGLNKILVYVIIGLSLVGGGVLSPTITGSW